MLPLLPLPLLLLHEPNHLVAAAHQQRRSAFAAAAAHAAASCLLAAATGRAAAETALGPLPAAALRLVGSPPLLLGYQTRCSLTPRQCPLVPASGPRNGPSGHMAGHPRPRPPPQLRRRRPLSLPLPLPLLAALLSEQPLLPALRLLLLALLPLLPQLPPLLPLTFPAPLLLTQSLQPQYRRC